MSHRRLILTSMSTPCYALVFLLCMLCQKGSLTNPNYFGQKDKTQAERNPGRKMNLNSGSLWQFKLCSQTLQ